MNLIIEIAENLHKDWEVSIPSAVSEEQLIELLSQRIAYLLDKQPEYFFQLMYRIDIPENILKATLERENPALQVAYLVYQRQKSKIESRQKHNTKRNDEDSSLSW